MNSYGAATLVLPYATTIPEGASCYTLNYTTGNASVKANAVETTLAANTAVLVNATKGKYKFVNTARSSGTAITGSDPVTVGALTGVYATTNVPSGSYILWANDENPVGFYKANSSTVAANRAYLTAGSSNARSLTIVYGGETDGIEAVAAQQGGDWLYTVAQIPFTAAGPWCSDKNHEAGKTQNGFGEKDRGQLRPGYEIFYKHYKDVSGSYFVKKYAEVQRPECGAGDARYGSNSGAFDQIGWGTLMLYQ